MEHFISIDKNYKNLYEINKSKFISFVYPVFDELKAKEILSNLKKEYKDASHICYAFILQNPQVEKCCDDGEPTGTAGKPMLDLLKKKKLNNILLVVIRYFGGIKLGVGGLLRAYVNSSQLVIDNCKIIDFVKVNKYLITVANTIGEKVKNYILSLDGEILNFKYNEYCSIEYLGNFEKELKNRFEIRDLIYLGSEYKCQK